jgi:hypothetical protein
VTARPSALLIRLGTSYLPFASAARTCAQAMTLALHDPSEHTPYPASVSSSNICHGCRVKWVIRRLYRWMVVMPNQAATSSLTGRRRPVQAVSKTANGDEGGQVRVGAKGSITAAVELDRGDKYTNGDVTRLELRLRGRKVPRRQRVRVATGPVRRWSCVVHDYYDRLLCLTRHRPAFPYRARVATSPKYTSRLVHGDHAWANEAIIELQ